MPVPIYTAKRDECEFLRFVAITSISTVLYTNKRERLLKGYLNIFEPAEKKLLRWKWMAYGHLLPDQTYRFESAILDAPHNHPETEKVTLFIINLLTALAADKEKRKIIDRDMAETFFVS